ncbi:DUF397 domain-containing protein [Streptomyces sp. HB132]|uniref:DUF397 domain-containing protein n=1 Tax=Streptomyces sp. HB132 TaxID=767388 RepID=UPI001961C029|nr:DUF397 domain-containing protein [Streptomyces sp. HB132]MBM7438913.1 hypothetical protein [Streptomyces sp. HB132]
MAEIPSSPAPATWFKSSYSGANTTECVEAAHLPDVTAVRDSKNPHGPVLRFGHKSWRGFLAGAPLHAG